MRPISYLIIFLYLGIASAQNISNPPGTIQLSENLFIDDVPVTNFMFLEYLKVKDSLKSEGYDSWKKYITDKQITEERAVMVFYPSFLKDLEGRKSLLSRRTYFRDIEYKNTPVLRITRAQAEDFCQWRTEMVEYSWRFYPEHADKRHLAGKIRYRLPSPEELEAARKYFSDKDRLVTIGKKNPMRYKPSTDHDKFTLYNISEFTSSDALFGENWKNVKPTEFPNDYTGFRCICEIER